MSEEGQDSGGPSPIDWDGWKPEIRATLMFILEGEEILLIRKLRGIGAGKVNGPGGKIDPGESPLEAAVRETREELHVTPIEPRKMGELCFAMSDIPDIFVHVFVARGCEGKAQETEEAIPLWTHRNRIPYELMWEDDQFWLPRMLEGEKFRGRFYFEAERILWMDIDWDVGCLD